MLVQNFSQKSYVAYSKHVKCNCLPNVSFLKKMSRCAVYYCSVLLILLFADIRSREGDEKIVMTLN